MPCQDALCRHNWRQNPVCDDVFADHESHDGDRQVTRAFRPVSPRASERIAEAEQLRQERLTDFVQRVANNDTSEESDDMPPATVQCNKENCNCVAHSDNSVFNSDQTDASFEATPTMLLAATKSPPTSDSGKDFNFEMCDF